MFDDLEINNNMKLEELCDNKTWIHGNTKDNILYTVFLITIKSEQLKYSLEAINNFNLDYSFIVNCIYCISPTSKAYNEMRIRCKTKFFLQIDEDMELYINCLNIIDNVIINKNDNLVFVHTFKLIDDVLGIGNPPVINCLKAYNHDIMKNYPIIDNVISSVDTQWHKKILNDNFTINSTNIIIGFHGKHRSDFDLLLRYCKILKTALIPNIKPTSSFVCKILKALFKEKNVELLIKQILFLFKQLKDIDYEILNKIIERLNAYVNPDILEIYYITNRIQINKINENDLIECTKKNFLNINNECLMALISICCISSNSYEYSFDNYPYEIYNFFV